MVRMLCKGTTKYDVWLLLLSFPTFSPTHTGSRSIHLFGFEFLIYYGPQPGVAMFDWHRDILPLLLRQRDNQKNSTVSFRHYRTYPTMQTQSNNTSRWSGNSIPTRASSRTLCRPSYAEVNHTVIGTDSSGTQFLYGVANDTFGCYKWNLGTCQIMTTYTIPPVRNVSLINNCYTMALNHTTKELLIGGEDGQLYIWNTETDRCVDVVDVNRIDGVHPNEGNPKGNSTNSIVPYQYIVINPNIINNNNNAIQNDLF